MSTHDYNLANQSGASFRSDLNNCLAAILSNNSNGSAPSTTVAYSIWADTTAGKLKIRNAANDGFVDLINLDGTIARDLTLTGASANIVFDQSDNALKFADNAKAIFGNGGDLEISHNGSNSIINDAGTGSVLFQLGGSTVLEILSTGFDVSGSGTNTVEINGNGGHELYSYHDSGGVGWATGLSSSYGELLYLDETNSAVEIFTGGTKRLTVNSSGNVGIGTASPTHLLHLQSASTPALKLLDTTNDATFLAYAQDADIHIGTYSNHPLIFDTNSSERVRIVADGKVGIGTSSPSRTLDVNGFIRSDGTSGGLSFGGNSSTPSEGAAIHRPAADSLAFVTGSSERLRVDSSGHFLFNCTSLPSSSVAGVAFEKNGSTGVYFHSNGSATTAVNVGEFMNGNGVVGRITTNGSNCSFTDASDYRLKENEVAISDGITRLKQLKPYRFNYKTDSSQTFDGFFAHEAQAVVPESVVGEKDATKKDGSIDPQCIDQSKLVPLLVAAVQELIGRVETLEAA